ncbi:MAG: rRNA maturation RNase YbeY [Patescibacteria group bacterium]
MVEINNTTKERVDARAVKKAAEIFLEKKRKSGYEVSVAFVGDAAIRKLNKAYRGMDKATDILTFAGEDKFLGEIIIDYRQIKRQAKEQGHSAKKELIFILIHGLFHLLGYEDDAEKDRLHMIKIGQKFIDRNLQEI